MRDACLRTGLAVLGLILGASVCLADTADPFVTLGMAGPQTWAILSLGRDGSTTSVTDTDDTIGGPPTLPGGGQIPAPPTTIQGNVGVAPYGTFAMSGNSVMYGTLYIYNTATLNSDTLSRIHGTPQITRFDPTQPPQPDIMDQAAAAAMAAYNQAASLTTNVLAPTNATLYSSNNGNIYNIESGASRVVISGTAGLNVLNLQDLNVGANGVIIDAPSDAKFVINIAGNFSTSGNAITTGIQVEGGISPYNVMYNVIGGSTGCSGGASTCVNFTGHGDADKSTPVQIPGIVLTPYRDINLGPAVITGELIGGGNNIFIGSAGSGVFCAVPEPASLLLLGAGVFLAGLRRRR